MKLLIIARPFVFHGGVETATAGLVRALVAHGHEVHLASGPAQSALPGVTLHRLVLPPLPATARLLAHAVAARIVAARESWDIVQSHERTLGQDVYRAGEGCHRAYLATRRDGGGRRLYHRVVLLLERRVFERTRRVVAIARAGAAEIRSLYGVPAERLAVVYNGVDLERFHPRNRARLCDAVRDEEGIPRHAWVVLFVGSGFERKGLATALDAFAGLADAAARFAVVGHGDTAPYRAEAARRSVADRVVWRAPDPAIERWYAAADVLVLPARYEPFGNVHLEALASGVPVVASARAGGSELIEAGRNGYVVDPLDPGAVREALERVRAAPVGQQRSEARRSAEPFTHAAQVAAFESIWRQFP